MSLVLHPRHSSGTCKLSSDYFQFPEEITERCFFCPVSVLDSGSMHFSDVCSLLYLPLVSFCLEHCLSMYTFELKTRNDLNEEIAFLSSKKGCQLSWHNKAGMCAGPPVLGAEKREKQHLTF